MTNMPATMKMEYKIGINAPLVRREAKTLMVEGDRCANTIVIEVMDGLEPADLAGCSVCAIMKRSDGARPFVHGTVEGNVVTVCLNESFYAVPGGYELLVRLTHTDGTKRVILWLHGWINDEGQGDVIDTENVVPDLEDLLAQIDAMEQATQSATAAAQTANQAAADATSTANAAAASAQATAEAAAAEAVQIATAKGDEAVQIATEQVEAQNKAIAKIATDLLTKAPAIECEASGSLVTVTDAAAQPAVQLVTHIEPVQEGEGDPSPDNVRPISGWDKVTAQRAGKNLLTYPYYNQTVTVNGVTFTDNGDGSVSAEGVSTNGLNFYIARKWYLKAGSYVISTSGDLVGGTLIVYDGGKNKYITRLDAHPGKATFTLSADVKNTSIYINQPYADVEFSGTIYPMLQFVSAAETAFEPYQGQTLTADLPETVYGGTVDWGTGVLTVKDVCITADGTRNWAYRVYNNIPYLIYGLPAAAVKGSGISSHFVRVGENHVAALQANTFFCTDTDVYVDPRIGEHTFGDAETYKDYLAAEYAAGTPVRFVYKLATPYTIQLTAQQLDMLKATNNLWSDTGDTDLVYVADTKLYIDQAIKAALNTTAGE